MDSRDAIADLFDIPKDEVVYESFDCMYHGTINSTGKLYLCDRHLCFFASIAGVPVKHVIAVDNIEKISLGGDSIEVVVNKDGKAKVKLCNKNYKYSKFLSKDATSRAEKLVSQIVGEEKVSSTKKEEKSNEKQDEVSGTFGQLGEVTFENFFGVEVKELFRSVLTYPIEKIAQCLLGPKSPIYGFEQVLPSVGMRLIRSDPWENNLRTQTSTRKFLYSIKHLDNVFQNTEIVESVQSFSIKK